MIAACWPFVCTLAAVIAAPGAANPAESDAVRKPTPQDAEFFEKQIRPILVQHCFECHGPAARNLKGGLRMTGHASLVQGGDTGAAIVPGMPEESLLIDAVNYGDMYQMPPRGKLPETEIAKLVEWVRRGAPWPADERPAVADAVFNLSQRKASHWCWQPVKRPPIPSVRDAAWPAGDIDRYILAKLEAQGLTPQRPADRNTLIRRLSFDLIGLPPTPAEVESFVADPAPQAVATVVDRLLASPHFGERWARHWMDLVRYAETHGHEFDFPIPYAFRYRDYLIRALNADVPYDQLLREHIAGDLLPNPRLHPTQRFNESIIATGFWWFGEAVQAPTDVLRDHADRVDNQIDVMTKAFLGLTVGCARCHDHKFDAISTQDYYALAGYLQSSRRQLAALDPHGRTADIARQLRTVASEAGRSLQAALVSDGIAQNLAACIGAASDAKSAGLQRPPSDVAAEDHDPKSHSQVRVGSTEDPDRQGQRTKRDAQLQKIAADRHVNPALVERWLDTLNSPAVRDPSSPIYPLATAPAHVPVQGEAGLAPVR